MKNQKNIEEYQLDFLSILRVVIKNWKLYILSIIVLTSIFIIIAKIKKDYYNTTVKIIYQQSNMSSADLGVLGQLAGFGLGTNKGYKPFIPDILYSNFILDSIINRKWKLSNGQYITLQKLWNIEIDSNVNNRKEVLKHVLRSKLRDDNYIVYGMSRAGLITIITSFEDPLLSYEVNKYIVKLLNDFVINQIHYKARESRKFIEKLMRKAKEELEEAENNLTTFVEKNRIINSPYLKLRYERLQRNVEIKKQIYLLLLKEYNMALIKEEKAVPVFDVIDPPDLPISKSRPKRKLIVILGFFASLIVSLFIVYFKEFFIRYKNDFIKSLHED